MNAVMIALKSVRQHWVSTAITALSIALAGGLWMSVWSIRDQANRAFEATDMGFDAVLGARGSALQLTLNAVFHLEASPGNLGYADYETIRDDRRVAAAYPIAVGDNLKGYRIVGTLPELILEHEYREGKGFEFQGAGRPFEASKREAVMGAMVAKRLGLWVGDTFQPYHGLDYDPAEKHDDLYTIVGVLEPTGTPADRVIWIPVLGVQVMDGHAPESREDVSAVLLRLKNPMAGHQLSLLYNKQGDRLTFAWPIASIIAALFAKISWFDQALALIAGLVAFVAVASVLASVYNTIEGRKRDVAIMRALGAPRRAIVGFVTMECALIAGIGSVLAYPIYLTLFVGVAGIVRSQTGVMLNVFTWNWALFWMPVLLVGLSAVMGLVPAWKAYQTDVAKNLAPLS